MTQHATRHPRHPCRRVMPLLAMLVVAPGLSADAESMEVLGWIETVSIDGGDFRLDAKLDTGADNSSLHAVDIETFEREDEEWVRFTTEDRDGETASFEATVEGTVLIRRLEGDPERRQVVKMKLCIDDVEREVEVNLTDRSALDYPMLIGRSFLKDHILVHSGARNTTEPDCGSGEG